MSLLINRAIGRRTLVAVCFVVLLLTGCSVPAIYDRRELSMPILALSGILKERPGGLPDIVLQLGSGKLIAEVASTPDQAAAGLAFRAGLAPDSAMLFTYPAPHKVAFYMKDTYIPLSIAYIDSMGMVLEIQELKPGVETPVTSKSNAVRFVLEVNRGWFEKYGVVQGSQIYVEQHKGDNAHALSPL